MKTHSGKVNFIDGDGKCGALTERDFICSTVAIKGNAYGRKREIYQCEDQYPYAEKQKEAKPYRASIRTNKDASEVRFKTLRVSFPGRCLEMNRSHPVEGTFGIIKNDRWYKTDCAKRDKIRST